MSNDHECISTYQEPPADANGAPRKMYAQWWFYSIKNSFYEFSRKVSK